MKTVLSKNISTDPLSSNEQKYSSERVSLLNCPISQFAKDQLWKLNQTIRVYLVSTATTTKDRKIFILKAFVTVPVVSIISSNPSQESFTLCTSPLHNKANYLVQWIEFHGLVGFSKFVIYYTTDANNHLSTIINIYTQKYPGFVDVLLTRYFQVEALHDCLIRYGDQSEWLGMLDLNKYIVPLHLYKTIVDYVHENFGRRIMGSINLWSQFFCNKNASAYTPEEKDTNRLAIERFTFRARNLYKSGREKYLYRPRFVQYLSVHHQIVDLSKQYPSEKHITLAHYASMSRLRTVPGCGTNEHIEDTSIRNRFVNRVKTTIATLNKTTFNDSKECHIILRERSGRLENRLFLFASAYVSDDKNYCRKTFGEKNNVLVTPDSFNAADDLAILTLCEHTILTVGTFGWWGAFLSHNRLGDVLTDSKPDYTPLDVNCRKDDFFPTIVFIFKHYELNYQNILPKNKYVF
ncbi:unnamed protein product, partial [Adineta steineri]